MSFMIECIKINTIGRNEKSKIIHCQSAVSCTATVRNFPDGSDPAVSLNESLDISRYVDNVKYNGNINKYTSDSSRIRWFVIKWYKNKVKINGYVEEHVTGTINHGSATNASQLNVRYNTSSQEMLFTPDEEYYISGVSDTAVRSCTDSSVFLLGVQP